MRSVFLKRAFVCAYSTFLLLACRPALASASGLNTIPTTDIQGLGTYVLGLQNQNPSFQAPAFYTSPNIGFSSQFGLGPNMEAGIDFVQPPAYQDNDVVFNVKYLLMRENYRLPSIAIGLQGLGPRQAASYYVAFSKTLNYAQRVYLKFRAHHRTNRKVLGHRIHAGLTIDHDGRVEPFVGTDIDLSDSNVLALDWISGAENALTLGLDFGLPDQVTDIQPVLLFSNETHRFSGIFISVGYQLNL